MHIPVVLKKIFPYAKAALTFAWNMTTHVRAESKAAANPVAAKPADEEIFDSALRRLRAADPADSMFTKLQLAVERTLTPEFLKTPSVQQWLAAAGVGSDLQLIVGKETLGLEPPAETLKTLECSFESLALANPQESRGIVRSIVNLLVAAVRSRTTNPGGAAILVMQTAESARRFDSIESKVDSIVRIVGSEPGAPTPRASLDGATASSWRDALRTASQDLLRWPSAVPSGQRIERPELLQLIATMEDEERATYALLGAPGSGKSALLAELGKALSVKPNVSLLAIKADLLGAEVASQEDLQRALGLPELPGEMLRRLTEHGPVVLLLDQLDALAWHLDVKAARLGVLLDLIKAVGVHPQVHVFVSCRPFEFEHDTRLRTVQADQVQLELPSWEAVLPILDANGVPAAGWNSDAKEVMRVPQQLNTYLRLKLAGSNEPVTTYQAMLETLWRKRVLEAPEGDKMAALAIKIADTMASEEILWLGTARFERDFLTLNALEAAGILTRSEHGAIGFSHQTVFDYVLARSFLAEEGKSLSSFIAARTESLFVRPKLWSALNYLRNVEIAAYEKELQAISKLPELRKHLRFLLIEFMGSQASPTDVEFMLLKAAFAESGLKAIVLKAITGSEGWLDRLGRTVIANAMATEGLAELCVALLTDGWRTHPALVEGLVRDHWMAISAEDRRTLVVLKNAPAWPASLIDMVETIFRRSSFNPGFTDYFLSSVGARDVEVAIRFLATALGSELDVARSRALELKRQAEAPATATTGRDDYSGYRNAPYRAIADMLDDSRNWGTVPELATLAPQAFATRLWPWYQRAFEMMAEFAGENGRYISYALPYQCDFRFDEEAASPLPASSLLDAITVAMEKLAEESPMQLVEWVDIHEHLDNTPVQRLIAHALSHNPERTASRALRYVLGDERRLFLGGISVTASTTIALVQACAPLWTDAEIRTFADGINAFDHALPAEREGPEAAQQWQHFILNARIRLFRALPLEKRPADVQALIDREDAEFPGRASARESMGEILTSSMTPEQFASATPEEIDGALRETAAREEEHLRYGRGGIGELSRGFAVYAKKEHAKSLAVLELVQPSYGELAAGYVLESIAEVGGDAKILMELAVRLSARGFGASDNEEFRVAVARACLHLLERKVVLTSDLVDLLTGWLSFAEPRMEVESDEDDSSATSSTNFLLSGLPPSRVIPGGDFPLLEAIIYARYGRDELPLVAPLMRRYLESVRNVRIWENVAPSLIHLVRQDPEGPRFMSELFTAIPALRGTSGAAVLMAHGRFEALDEVLLELAQWKLSTKLSARKGYGELVVLLAIDTPPSQQANAWLKALTSDPSMQDMREGAAAMIVNHLWLENALHTAANDALIALLDRGEACVWTQVFDLFRNIDRLDDEPPTIAFLQKIRDRIDLAPVPSDAAIVERLGGLLPSQAELVAQIASRLIELWRDELTNMGASLVVAAQTIMNIAVTLHRISGMELVGLTMFEQLVEIDAFQARETLNEIDRRTQLATAPRPAMLPRKARRRRSRLLRRAAP